jgi:predicted small secreted protein
VQHVVELLDFSCALVITLNDYKGKGMKNKLPRWLTLFMVVLFSASVISCATIEGAGKDIESAGEAIQEKAEENN